jgi:hypothetical protein
MMRRMEARISSIDGSCDFAGWFIPPRHICYEFFEPALQQLDMSEHAAQRRINA